MIIKYISCDNSIVSEQIVSVEETSSLYSDKPFMICTRENGNVFEVDCDRVIELKKVDPRDVPKKVKRETYEVNNGGQLSEGIIYKCPSCENQDTIWDITGDGMKYCGECGQRLDWEGWNDGSNV